MGPFDRFNDRAKRVLALAQDEAIRFSHNYIGTEHLLLGLIREGESTAARVLDSLGVDLSRLRSTVEASIGRGSWEKPPTEITLAAQTKSVINLAIDEARQLGHGHVGTEHLLLGIVREGADSPAARSLAAFGVDLEKVRHATIAALGPAGSPAATTSQTTVSGAWAPSTTRGRGMGPFDRFNDRAKRVLALAQDEAIRFNHNYIGTEHLLLGLAREGEGVAGRTLDALGITLAKLRTSVEKIMGRGDSTTSPSEITLSPRTKKVIEYAIDEARKLGHGAVGTEHLLLGLVREGGHIGAQAIESLGVTLDKVRAGVLAAMGQTEHVTRRQQEFVFVGHDVPSSGPFDLLDKPAKRVLSLAEEEARLMRHDWIGTEHMMIALLRSDGVAQRALQELGVTLDQARAGVFTAVPPRETDVTEMTVTPRVKTLLGKAITLAAPTADRVKPQHLLLALVADPDGIGSQVLAQLGVTPEKLRATVDRLSAG